MEEQPGFVVRMFCIKMREGDVDAAEPNLPNGIINVKNHTHVHVRWHFTIIWHHYLYEQNRKEK